MELIRLELSDHEMCQQWDAFVETFGYRGAHHKTQYLKAILNVYSHEHLSVYCVVDGEIVGVLPLIGMKSPLFGRQVTSTPFYNYGGPLSHRDDINERLCDEARQLASQQGYQAVQLRSDRPMDKANWFTQSHKANLLLTLPDDIKKIGAGNAKKRAKLRSQAGLASRKAEEANVSLEQRFGGLELLDDFYRVFSAHMRDLGTPVFGKDFFQSMLSQIPSTLTVVYWDNEAVGCGFLFEQGDHVSIPWASTLKRMNPVSLNTYMYYNILTRCIDNHIKVFDFGRSSVDAGTYKFKLQWGAEPQPCYWHGWRDDGIIPESSAPAEGKFGLMVTAWKKLPLLVANFIGPKLIKYIPG